MSDKDSKIAFVGARDGQQKFDYFVTGLTGALFAYIAQTFHPQKLALSADSLEPLALVLLACSFFAGLKRIESAITVMGLNHEMLDAGEKAGNMTQALVHGTGGFNPHSGHAIHPQEVPAKRQHYMQMSQIAMEAMERAAGRSNTFYKLRNNLLVAGFITIALAKILKPYF